jgi:hypothetical protein
MSNARSDDYFAFMAAKQRGTSAEQVRSNASVQGAFTDSDVIEYIEEPQIEVTESFVSDTMIQRIFGRFREQLPMALEEG